MSVVVALAAVLACHASRPTESTLEDLTRARSTDERVDAIARKCARIASCAHSHDAPRFRDPRVCVDDWLERMEAGADPVEDCLSAATTCKDVDACLHGAGDPRAAAFCATHPDVVSACEGDTLIGCVKDDVGESSATACAPLGAICGETRSAGGLVAHGCLSPSACPEGATGMRCDGDGAVVACHDQIEERTLCKTGTTCHAHKDEDGEQAATCEAPGEISCGTIGERSCRGSVLVRCDAHGHHGREAHVDCGAFGLVCSEVTGRATCATGEAHCTGTAPRCEGETLAFCAAGRLERIECGDLGLGPCERDANGPVALCGVGHARRRRW